MAVPVWKRNSEESKLNLFVEARDFAKHMLQVTANEKIFNPKYQLTITDRLIKDSLDLYTNLWKANTTNLNSFPTKRLELQQAALENIQDILCIWDLSKSTFHIKHNKEVYVINKLLLIKGTTLKWINNDRDRLSEK